MLGKLRSSYKKIQNALSKTRAFFTQRLTSIFKEKLDEDALEHLEQLFYEADLGIGISQELVEKIRDAWHKNPGIAPHQLLEYVKAFLLEKLVTAKKNAPSTAALQVVLVVGVNGSGKTTTTAKLAAHFKKEGRKVLLVAGDTFRAAATEQLGKWADRLGVEIVKGYEGADPSSVVFDALSAAKAREIDLVLIDTAGRLHSKLPLMQELEKIRKVCHKVHPGAPHETLLVLDANIGQNALDQAQVFSQHTPLSGLVLAKLDGSSKGGSVFAIQHALKIPVQWVGVGEGLEDLEPFSPQEFVESLFETSPS